MHHVLVTGSTSFLGYHVVKRLNEAGLRPRVLELPGAATAPLERLLVDRCAGTLADPAALRAACTGADTVLHLAFKVGVGGGAGLVEEMRRVNVEGTSRLVRAAAACGVRRVVVTGSALAVGVNRQPRPLDERAAWSEHAFDLPYALTRREAEQEALSLASPRLAVVAVCPSFTFGPDDPVGAPANSLLRSIAAGTQRFTLPVGFGCLDVRDFATGMLLAAEHGRSGERYLLSGENVTTAQLLAQAAAMAGTRPPSFTPPLPLLRALVAAIEAISWIRRRPAPVTRHVLQIVNRYAWYDASKARVELGWTPRPLAETLHDTIHWLRAGGQAPADISAREHGQVA